MSPSTGHCQIYAAEDIARGTELTHSYVVPHWLLFPAALRAAQLHFTCRCSRCLFELAAPEEAQSLAALALPVNHCHTAAGRLVGSFKMALA